jgi:Fur family ferric uptake transcriptional regulator
MQTDFAHLLKEHKLSLTAVRLAVLEALYEHPHADAARIFDEVRKKTPSATIQAVYNNLNTLAGKGIIREIKPKGQASLYETRVGDNHHHIVCRNCGAVMDADCPSCAPCMLPADSRGYVVDEAEVIFWGICPSCQKPKRKRTKHK